MKTRTKTRAIVVHCSATRPHMDVGVTELRKWHKARGWEDVGYHRIIRRSGVIELGRPIMAVGSHAKGRNHDTVAVCLVGGVAMDGSPEDNFTAAQKRALRDLLRDWQKQFPGAEILGHRDLYGDTNGDGKVDSRDWLKACPSFDVRAWWSSVA